MEGLRGIRGARRATLAAVCVVALAAPAAGWASESPAPPDPQPARVEVERVRPERPRWETLRFLKANRDFLRARLDGLRQTPAAGSAVARSIDPRFLAYRRMMEEALAARDSLGRARADLEGRQLLRSVADVARLEAELDLMERSLADQRGRLAGLQADFAGRQRTALAVVVAGYPGEGDLDSLALRLDGGAAVAIALSPAERDALRGGATLEIFHGLVEPREQVVEVLLAGASWPAGDRGFVTLDPARDGLTFLRLDLSTLRAEVGAPGVVATSWVHDATLRTGKDLETGP